MKKHKIVILYFFISFIWLFISNNLLIYFIDLAHVYYFERIKEVFYIIVSGAGLTLLLIKKEELDTTKEEEKLLSTLINSMVDFVNFKDGDGRWIQCNEYGLKLFQLENVDYRGKKDSELAKGTEFFADVLKFCEQSDEETWKNGKVTRSEEVIPQPDGTSKTFDTIKVPLFHGDGSRMGLVIIGRDVTKKIRMGKLLAESQQQYKSLFEFNPDMVYMLDLNGVVTNLNPQFEIITGYKPDTLLGKNIADLFSGDYRDQIFPIMTSVIYDKEPKEFEMQFAHAKGHFITLQCTSLPIIIDGVVSGIIGYGKDVTKIRQTEEQLRRTETLSVVGELSASIAHEIRNPLTSLKGFVQLLQMEDKKHLKYYQIMLDELNRINHIVSELLLLAKPQHIRFIETSIQKIITDVLSLLRLEANLHNVHIEILFPEKDLLIECEPYQLKQLFINLIKNSIEATKKGGTIWIELKNSENDHVSITIKDEGCGISKDRLKKIGEPFYSSKERGTGLGLTVSYKIVQSHRGRIKFESEINEGTTVRIVLPRNQSHSLTAEQPEN